MTKRAPTLQDAYGVWEQIKRDYNGPALPAEFVTHANVNILEMMRAKHHVQQTEKAKKK